MLSITEREYEGLKKILTKFVKESNVRVCFIIDRSGQLINKSEDGDAVSKDITFASLIAGNVAASEALSKLLGNKNMKHTFTETHGEAIYMFPILSGSFIIVVVFDKHSSNLGVVKTKMDKYMPGVLKILNKAESRSKEEVLMAVRELTVEDLKDIFI